jgi:hypothetical protein
MNPRVSQIALAGTILVLIFAIGTNVISLLSQKAFSVPGSARPSQMSMTAALDTMAPEGTLLPGAEATIAILQKNDGSTTNIGVAEGTFELSTIQPRATWSKILKMPSVIVSSADELLCNDDGISESIGAGCSIDQSHFPLPTGTANLDSCKGSYKQAFPNIEYVASATWSLGRG